MSLNLARLKKSEYIFLATHRCKHRKTYLEHPHCFEKEKPQFQKIGFFDIEATSLAAPWAVLICYAILDDQTDKIYANHINAKDMKTKGIRDKKLIEKCIKDMMRFDKLITYGGKHFDLRFIRTRAATWGLEFPPYGSIKHEDLFYIAKHRYDTGKRYPSMEQALWTLTGQCRKTHHRPEQWLASIQGDPEGIQYTMEHCIIDVQETKRLYRAIIQAARRTDVSI